MLVSKFVILEAALLFAGFVVAEPLLAEPVSAKDEPLYVGDFYGSSVRRQVEIVDDGPVIRRPYMHAPLDEPVSVNKPVLPSPQIRVEDKTPVIQVPSEARRPFPASLQSIDAQGQRGLLGRQYAASKAQFERERAAGIRVGPHCDFPLPKLNFPREIGAAGKYALPMTASPRVMSVPVKPMGVGGAARKGEAPRLSKPTSRRASAVPIQTYSTGYVPGSTSTEHKSKGLR